MSYFFRISLNSPTKNVVCRVTRDQIDAKEILDLRLKFAITKATRIIRDIAEPLLQTTAHEITRGCQITILRCDDVGGKNYLGKLRTCVMPGLPQMCTV